MPRECPPRVPGLVEAVSRRPTKGRTPLQVQVRHEPGRGSREVMARNYERIVPIRRRPLGTIDSSPTSAAAKRAAEKPCSHEGVA